MDAAHSAALTAANAFIAGAPKDEEGRVLDACGSAHVLIYKPSYRFRKTLERLGEIHSDYRGAWSVSTFTKGVTSQSFQAAQHAAQAAREVLEREFPEEPQFFAQSYLT